MIGKKGMLRIVKDKEGGISLDLTGKKNGRGAYICRDKKCFETARKKKALERSLKCQIPAEVYDRLLQELEGIKPEEGSE
ncbi:MAG: YlxR family protein [Firmicutes bacterium]|nr:YlxR family protein [[Eubacterium] siraeum]MCM1488218.1 YlxR family protein [Bacillota bacterium]